MHLITAEGIQPEPVKVQMISKFPLAKKIKDLRRLLSVLNLNRRFMPTAVHFQSILNGYLVAGSPETAQAFETTKQATL